MAENEQKNETNRREGGGRKGAFLLRITTLLFLLGQLCSARAEGNVGCQFVKTLCLDENEFCYDDLVFGKCLPISGVEQEDIEKRPLTEEQSRILGTMLEEMQGAGLGWNHPFVQCRIQGTLFSLRRDTPLPPNLCASLAPDPEILGPQSPLAFVRFTPPNENFADEVYYPPPKKEQNEHEFVPRGHSLRIESIQPHPPQLSNNFEFIPEFNQPNLEANIHRQQLVPSTFNNEFRDSFDKEELSNRVKDIKNRIELRRMMGQYEQGQLRPPIYANNDVFPEEDELYDDLELYKRKEIRGPSEPGTFFREMAINEHIPLNPERERLINYKSNPFETLLPPTDRLQKKNNNLVNDDDMFASNIYPVKYPKKTEGVYTEGGLLFVPERTSNDGNEYEDRKKEARILLANMLGFTRHERLDVKKPGPLVGPPPSASSTINDNSLNKNEKISATKELLPEHIKSESVPKKKNQVKEHSDEDHAPHTFDNEYAHVFLKNPLDDWRVGSRIVNELANILHMQGFFTHLRVDRHEVSFRVDPSNLEGKNASDVARAINDPRVQNNLYRRMGVTVVLAGVGNKVKSNDLTVSSSRIELAEEGPDVTHIMAYMFAGAGAAAVIVIVVILFLIRRNDKKRDKLGGIQSGVSASESCSKDYQELCRARMAGKGNNSEQPASGRITSLTKENDRPPSSRSSTSSWSEEPALTNMDISTGHMVLSYMEDHLRNKGRLQREWEALCRYEAEPSARDAATQPQCSTLNRATAPLPYDHSRVVLNHLANAEGLDYVNASTITDHDPRAPAYVAAQGPLPTTLAHFWQMIWEQGAVVIVSLCRLQENGEIACARYWPEEGAEVYHIYEVHLVSEHIWCEDYLVRSFYLKNLRTSETRTVTQFHFLSWPQGGVPSSAKALLDFRRKVNKSYRGRSCPIVVHGSTGAGRTGAYILLDLVLGRMNKGAREIDIAATLEHLRDQRAGLVATRQQFEFVLMAVAEEVHAILKALPANQSEKRDLDKEPAVKEEENPDTRDDKQKKEKEKEISPTKKDKEKEKKNDKKSEN